MSDILFPYRHSPLWPRPDSIRLLRLMPHEEETAPIQCQLFNYSLQETGKGAHLYEAISYVWGDSNNPQYIYIDKHPFNVTENLHMALSRLRNHFFERIIWVDAVCINQTNDQEKEHQIQSMAKIYGQANRVVIWLGKMMENSDLALEEIRLAADKKPMNSSNKEMIQQAILALLQRPWFERIWVLQEVAAARDILIICGSTEMDGYVFCLGLDLLKGFIEIRQSLQSLISSITSLIQGAIFRPKYATSTSGWDSPKASSLGELIDRYHTHKATKHHDKVYALLGMCSDDLSEAGLLPNYEIPWKELLQLLVKFLLCEQVSVETWDNKEIAVIKSKGCVLGTVSVGSDITWDDGQRTDFIFKNTSGQPGYIREWSAHWNSQASAKSIRNGDVICLLQGASKPMIIRLYDDYLTIIMIAATPPENLRTESGDIKSLELLQSIKLFSREFLLVWDWENSLEKLQDSEKYDNLLRKNNLISEHYKKEFEDYLDKATRIWNIALILGDLKDYKKAEERLQEARKGYEKLFREEHPHKLESQYGLTPLSWAAGNGHDELASLLLTKDGVNPDLTDSQHGRTPLCWAVKRGHETVVKLLLETGKVKVNCEDKDGRTPLSWAAGEGHETIVKLLLETGKVDVNYKDKDRRTPPSWAVKGGHETIVKLLLETGKVNVNCEDKEGRTLLSWAAEGGHETIVKLLFETGKVDVNYKDKDGWTPLSWTARGGHEAVVKLLLKTGKADANCEDKDGRTSLSWAAGEGYETVVKLLLKTGKFNVNDEDKDGRTLLSWAAGGGHETIVKLLLETGKVNVDYEDKDGRTPLSWTVEKGHKTVVKLLLETGKVDVNCKDKDGWTPLLWAVWEGHETVVKLLLETEKVNVDCEDKYGWTPLSEAARGGQETVVKLLLETGKVNVDHKEYDGKTALWWAAQGGHGVIVKLLLETGKVDVNCMDSRRQTPLLWAVWEGHETVVKLLLKTGKVDVNCKDKYGQTPLWEAAQRGHVAIVKLLLETGNVNVNYEQFSGRTVLSWAAGGGHEAVVKLLLETGKVDVDRKDKGPLFLVGGPRADGRTALSWAAGGGHEAVVKLLLKTGKVDVNCKDKEGLTALSWAAGGGHETVVKLLLKTGKVDVNCKDKYGRTPLSWAAGKGHEAVVKLLRSKYSQITDHT